MAKKNPLDALLKDHSPTAQMVNAQRAYVSITRHGYAKFKVSDSYVDIEPRAARDSFNIVRNLPDLTVERKRSIQLEMLSALLVVAANDGIEPQVTRGKDGRDEILLQIPKRFQYQEQQRRKRS